MIITLVTSEGCKCCEDFQPFFNKLKEYYPKYKYVNEDINQTKFKNIKGVPALFVEDKQIPCFNDFIKLKNEVENKIIDIINKKNE